MEKKVHHYAHHKDANCACVYKGVFTGGFSEFNAPVKFWNRWLTVQMNAKL